jgi:LacI family transcriptional regulator, galactose operon repressor
VSTAVTIADVAARAGVSKTTVSRVLNGKGELDRSTAARVRAVIAELGYVRSARAVNLARGRSQVVGMLVPGLTWPWMAEVLQGVIDTVESAGYGMLLFTCTRGEESMRQFSSQVSSSAFDGLLVVEPEGTLGYITELHGRGLPVVMIDDRGNQPLFCSVVTTNRDGAAAAAEHLISLGRKRPLVITGPARFGCTADRCAGFAQRYLDAGLPIPDELVVEGDFTFESGQAAVQRIRAAGLEFDAVFAHNDLTAAGAMKAVQAAGMRVPEDVGVVGFDDIPLASYTGPPMTTVHQPMRQLGASAAELLIGHFQGKPLPQAPTVLPTTLIARGSTASPVFAEQS